MTLKIIKWAMEHGITGYRTVDNFVPDAEWGGESPGPNGGEIHLIAQMDTNRGGREIYGETTGNPDDVSYLVTDDGMPQAGTDLAAVEELLDIVFNDQSEWPDTWAHTHGWFV
jgi:hypothetical protein